MAPARLEHLRQQVDRAHIVGLRGLERARGRFGALEVAGIALRLRQHVRHADVVRRDLQRGLQDVARLAPDGPALMQRRGAPRRDFGVARVEPLHLGPRLGRLRPPALVIVELGELDAAAEELRLVVEQVWSASRPRRRASRPLPARPPAAPSLPHTAAARGRCGGGAGWRRRDDRARDTGAPARGRSTGRRCRRRARSRAPPSPASHTPPHRRPAAPPGAARGQRREDRAEDAVGFLVLGIDLERVFGRGDGLGRLVLRARRARPARRAARRSSARARSPCAARRPPRRSCRPLRGSGRAGSNRSASSPGGGNLRPRGAGAWTASDRHERREGSRIIIKADDYNSLSYGRRS